MVVRYEAGCRFGFELQDYAMQSMWHKVLKCFAYFNKEREGEERSGRIMRRKR